MTISNEEYMKLYEQFEQMIIKLVNKWSKICVIEYDDLMQIALLALIHTANTYDETKGTKFSTYVYTTIEYKLRKEIDTVNKKNKQYGKLVSINTTVENGEGETTELIDLLADNINIQEEIEDKIMYDTYKSEIEKYLDPKKADVMILKYFECMTNNYIEKVLDITGVSNYVRESRMTLIRKSPLFMAEYRRIHGISDYNTERIALM